MKFNKDNSAFELKGSLVTLTVMYLLNHELKTFIAQLENSIKNSPNLFKNMPLIIDLQKVNQSTELLDLLAISNELRRYKIIPIGIRNGNEQQNLLASAAGLAILSNRESPAEKPSKANDAAAPSKAQHTLVITKPIRSGQQVYAKDANLIVLAMVNHGSELLADGHIHIYGALCGRALAGISGDLDARIFCHSLQAELVSIAGYYKLKDDIKPPENAVSTQVYLEDGHLIVSGLD